MYDDFIYFYFNQGEMQVKKYLKSERLTSTLYLLIRKYVIYKVQIAIKRSTENILEEDVIAYDSIYRFDEFFLEYISLLNNYRKLVSIDY